MGTRWKSWESIGPGMSIGMRFDVPQSIDRVEVDSLDPQWDSQMNLRILTGAGQWLEFPVTWQMNPPADARKAGTRELIREGIHFVVIPKNPRNSEVFKDPPAWGLTELASSRDSTLYRID
jgi:hypothetical protein